MRRAGDLARSSMALPAGAVEPPRGHTDWATLKRLFPYLWQYKLRVVGALVFMIAAKLANVGVPMLLKTLVDAMSFKPGDPSAVLVVPVGLLLAYGLLRLSTTLFTELREFIFSKATQGAARSIALQTFQHLHALSLRFHLERQTGGMTRDIERGVRGIESLISYSLFSIFPTLIEVALVLSILGAKFDMWFVWITLGALAFYIVYTVTVTEWRTKFRKEANEFDSAAHTKAVDSLLNYETVKYFNNEEFESRRYDESLQKLRIARLKSQTTLSMLNTGQQLIIAVGLVAMLWRATQGVVDGRMTLGDLVMVNAFMIQLYIPLNFLGVLYREIKQSLTDLDKMFVLMEKEREVADKPGAQPLAIGGDATVRFENVSFAYEPARPILHHVSFEIPAGKTVAVVGPSGSGKSTLARLLYRFYDVQHGRITIAGQDIREVTQSSVRQAIGIVPQDTVLFNDTVEYNIAYGRPGREPRRSGGGRPGRAHPRLHRVHAQRLRHHGGRARAETLRRREAARGHRPHAAEEPADHDLRRGHLRARFRQRARDPGRAEGRGAEQDDAGHRASPVHGGGRARDPGAGGGPDHRARHAQRVAGARRTLCGDVGVAAAKR